MGEVVHIPLVHGAHEGVDPKLLPQGWLTRAENVRFRKDGRLGARYGYDFITGSQGVAVASATFDRTHSVYIKDRVDGTTPAKWYTYNPDGTFSTPAANAAVGTVGVPRRIPVGRNVRYGVVASDFGAAGSYHFVAIGDADRASSNFATATTKVLVLDALSGKLVTTIEFESVGVRASNPKIVVMGSTVAVFYTTGTNVRVKLINSSTLATSTVTAVTAHTDRGFSFDAAPLNATTCLLAYEQSATNIRWGTVNTSGTFTSVQDTTIADPSRLAITLGNAGNVVLAWAEGTTFRTGSMNYRVSTTGGTQVVAVTSISGDAPCGFPVAGPSVAHDYVIAWNASIGGCDVFAGGTVYVLQTVSAISKPFAGPTNSTLMWATNMGRNEDGFATYCLVDVATLSASSLMVTAIFEAVSCQDDAMPGAYVTNDALAQTLIDNRRFCVSATTVVSSPSATAVACALPVRVADKYGADLVRIDSGPYVDRLLPAKVNGRVMFSGPIVREYDGSRLYESGFYEAPILFNQTSSPSATALAAGTYQYVLVFEWFDGAGCLHRSIPSDPIEVTLAVPSTVTITPLDLGLRSRPNLAMRGYRTEADGEVFHLLDVIGIFSESISPAITDDAPDSEIIDNEVLYTQGERGGLSGLLQNDMPPPCRFIWPGSSRVIVGGLEDPAEVRWSKLIFPGEPVQFSNNEAYRGRIDGEVLGVASLDGVWYAGSREAIWAFNGQGPSDNGAGGDFGEPVKLPSDVGFYSQRSIVEVPQGLLFQGASDRMYLLPRGGGAPQWVGQQVRATLALYPLVTDAQLLADENTVIFSCANTAGTDGVLLVYDTRIGEWTVDIPFNGAAATTKVFRCLNHHGGKLILDGQFAETSAYVDDETGSQTRTIVSTLVTGDIRPFGVLGNGRMRRAVLLGEYRSASIFTVEESVDSGVSWQTAVTFTPSNSAGDTVKTQYDLPIVRGEAFRFRITVTPYPTAGEGMVFNNLSCEVFPQPGTPRLANAYRA